MDAMTTSQDQETANAFAQSWNHLANGSVYTTDQFTDWMSPLGQVDIQGKRVLELGCGNGSLMIHMIDWNPAFLEGVDLGDSIVTARKNLSNVPHTKWEVSQADLTAFTSPEPFDVTYCIGVLHHLKDPKAGFDAVLRNTKSRGCFHCWVYAREGNGIVRYVVDPIRKIASQLPWWFTKYLLATPLVVPVFFYAKLLSRLPRFEAFCHLPLYEYSLWIAKRDFSFFRHVAFDQLVTPQTTYIPRETIASWLQQESIDQKSTYIASRNANSWKFGGRIK